jgi:hypothetical protein
VTATQTLTAVLLVLAIGGSGAAVLGMQFRFMKDARAQIAENPIPGSRRRAILSGVGFLGFIAVEVGLGFLGLALGGPTLGGALVIAGVIVFFIVGIVAGVWDDARRRKSGTA